jgi:hypothetical protein
MIECKNGFLACEQLQIEPSQTKPNGAFRGRDDKGLVWTTVLAGNSEYPKGTKIWLKNADRHLDEYTNGSDKFVLISISEIVLADRPGAEQHVWKKLDTNESAVVSSLIEILRRLLP